MRLSDLIKKDSDGEEKKPQSSDSAKTSEKEKPFRLSELDELRKSLETQEQPPPPPSKSVGEERPIQPPDFFENPSIEEEITPLVSPPAPASDLSFQTPEAAAKNLPPPVNAKHGRRSVLMGPDTEEGLGEDPVDSGQIEFPENPYASLRESALKCITQILQSTSAGNAHPLDEAEDIIWKCIEGPDALEHLYSLAVSAKDTSNSLAIHLFNHSIYSLKLGTGLRWGEERLIRLGVASMIHDIGMCQVPQHIRHKEGKLDPEEVAEIRNHCRYGMDIILSLYGEPFKWLAEAIYQEHEREDGQGYPQGLVGNQISDYAKIIGLADVYEALTHNRPHRKRLLPHKAVQEIVQTQKTQFHQKLLKVMLEELSVFSLNSLVRLNSNAIGRVAETIGGHPLRPVIQLLFDADGNEILEERFISLKEFPLLYIVDEVEESELPTH